MSPASRLRLAREATKTQLKARVALDGPSGAGKTWTALEWATVLADGGRILVIDTEHGSASLYADHFTFETVPWDPPYSPTELADTIKDAVKDGYAVINVDSLSHFWEGEGGTRDMVDAAAEKAKGNQFAGWKVGTPALRYLIDTMLAADAHLIATMRSKMEYVLETDSRGRQVPKKVGMAPVMRAGVEYEFTLVGDLDLDHRIMITKSRCSALADELIAPGRAAEAAERFRSWLNDGEAAPPAPPPEEPTIAVVDAKRRLLAACNGDRVFATALWNGREQVTADELADLITAAHAAADTASRPDGVGVADDLAPEAQAPLDDAPTTGIEEHIDTPESAAGALPAAGPGPLRPLQRKMHALAGQAWPDQRDRDRNRHGVISALTDGRYTSSSDVDDDCLSDVCDALQAIIDGNLELHQKATGEWDLRQARGKRGAA